MQGVTDGRSGNLWQEFVKPMMINTDIFCLQECGVISELYRDVAPFPQTFPVGTRTRVEFYLTYYPWDQNGHRVNLSILSKVEPDNCFFTPIDAYRGVLCAQFGNLLVGSIHGKRNETIRLIQHVQNNVWDYDIIIAGDFNLNPQKVEEETNMTVIYPNSGTHNCRYFGENILDYLATNSYHNLRPSILSTGAASDHCAVLYSD